jgi:DNA-binding response OmpR family regulator
MPPTGPTILIISADPDVLDWVSADLRTSGFRVLSANEAAIALLLAQRRGPKAIILDLDLPGGGGIRLMRRLRTLIPLSGIPIITLVGRPLTVDEEDRVEIDAKAHLYKPLDIEELQLILRTFIGGPDVEPGELGKPPHT